MTRSMQKTRRSSHKLSWLLRHGANEAGLTMDHAGWADIADVCRILRLKREAIDSAVAENNKQRYQVVGNRIRATQGHSLKGTPVTRDALEDSWSVFEGDGLVWHGTNIEAVAGIAQEGIHSSKRTHVHLAAALNSTVGKRAHVHVMLGTDAATLRAHGQEVFVSSNGVVLVRFVPVACISTLRAMTRRARDQERHLASLLDL